jgi:hypothetical protein
VKSFDSVDTVKLRVGALPQYPSNALNYNLTWSTDGVINEYCEPCEAIVNGLRREVPALAELEEFSLDGVTYEAFNTSGGLGTLCETLEGKVRNLNYRVGARRSPDDGDVASARGLWRHIGFQFSRRGVVMECCASYRLWRSGGLETVRKSIALSTCHACSRYTGAAALW